MVTSIGRPRWLNDALGRQVQQVAIKGSSSQLVDLCPLPIIEENPSKLLDCLGKPLVKYKDKYWKL